MKNKIRVLIVLALLVALSSVFCIDSFALSADSGIEYTVSQDGSYIIVTGCSESFPSIKIESEIDGLPVKEIAPSAFQNNYSLYKIVIPDSVSVIGEAAFRNCQSLVSVTVSRSVSKIPTDCFRDCFVLKKITLHDGVSSIGDFAFEGCKKLGKLKIPSSVAEIGHDAFMSCESIRLDVSENEYARAYAEANNVNLGFEGSDLYIWTVILIVVAIAGALSVAITVLMRRHIKKHPSHNPEIYIVKGAGAVSGFFGRIFSAIKKFFELLLCKIISFFEKIKKRFKR